MDRAAEATSPCGSMNEHHIASSETLPSAATFGCLAPAETAFESIAATYREMRGRGGRPTIALANLMLAGGGPSEALRAATHVGEALPELYVALRNLGCAPDETLTMLARC